MSRVAVAEAGYLTAVAGSAVAAGATRMRRSTAATTEMTVRAVTTL